jgi:hypothetical protein
MPALVAGIHEFFATNGEEQQDVDPRHKAGGDTRFRIKSGGDKKCMPGHDENAPAHPSSQPTHPHDACVANWR